MAEKTKFKTRIVGGFMTRPLAYITAAWSTNEHEAKAEAGKYCRDLYQAGYSPICPILFQGEFLNDSDTTEYKDKIDMAEELLRRSRVVVSCGNTVNDDILSDIALAKRLGIVYTTLDGILKADQKVK